MMVGPSETADVASEEPKQSVATVESESKEDTAKKEAEEKVKAQALAKKRERKKGTGRESKS